MDTKSLAHTAHPSEAPEERNCFACYEGVVYLGRLVEEDGEEVEVFKAVSCRRCAGTDLVMDIGRL